MKRRGFVCLPCVERKDSSSNRSLQKLSPNVELQVDCKFAQNVFLNIFLDFVSLMFIHIAFLQEEETVNRSPRNRKPRKD